MNAEVLTLTDNSIELEVEGLHLRINPAGDHKMRLWLTQDDFRYHTHHILADNAILESTAEITKNDNEIKINGSGIHARITMQPFSVAFYRGDKLLLTTAPAAFSKDGHRMTARFNLIEGESVYGLGQGTYHRLDLRDMERRMWNQYDHNRFSGNAGIPFLYNSQGYSVFLNSSWASRIALGKAQPCEGSKDAPPNAPWAMDEIGDETDPLSWAITTEGGDIDLFISAGETPLEALRSYYELTGYPPMLPKWALGLLQCKNRYKNQKQLLTVAREYRRRGLPLDAIIIDWNWFKYFGFLRFESNDWPDPEGMFRELKSMGIHVMAAIHPYMHSESPFFDAFKQVGGLIEWDPDLSKNWPPFGIHHAIDFSSPKARELFYQTVKPLLDMGLSGFWTDMGELEIHPESSSPMFLGEREEVHNLYTNCWLESLYGSQRRDYNLRPFELPRTSFAGTQRYSCALWTGDVDCDFDVLRDQVLIGQQVSVSGQPFFCTDIGGFISMPYYDPELFVRWYEWGVFCPVFRTHGTRPDNEPWVFGERNARTIETHLRLRYRLLPFIYSAMNRVHSEGCPMVLPMPIAFANDENTHGRDEQYMFGSELLISPVLKRGDIRKATYLPNGKWYDFYNGVSYNGAAEIVADAPLERIPVFVRAGAVIPLADIADSTERIDQTHITLKVYSGADRTYTLYEDDGKSFDYEIGEALTTQIDWDNTARMLKIQPAHGHFSGLVENRRFTVIFVGLGGSAQCLVDGNTAAGLYTPENDEFTLELPEASIRSARSIQLGMTENPQMPHSEPSVDYSIEYNAAKPERVLRLYAYNLSVEKTKLCVKYILPTGWRLSDQSELLSPGSVISENATTDQGITVLIPQGLSELRIPFKMYGAQSASARLQFTAQLYGKQYDFNERLHSKWATWWTIATAYTFDSPDGFNRPLPPDSAPCLAGADEQLTLVKYADHQCFGYVNMQKAMLSSIPFEKLQGMSSAYNVGYAACIMNLPQDMDINLLIMGEDRMLVILDGTIVMRVEDHFEAPQKNSLHLSAGRHRILVKISQDMRSEWNDRAWGFYLRAADNKGEPIENILFEAE